MTSLVLFAFALTWTTDEQEAFLKTAKITETRRVGVGITESKRVTLKDGGRTHQAHVQRVDVRLKEARGLRRTELNFRDCWTYNVAAYRLSRLLGLDTVPVSVERRVAGDSTSVTWWIDDVLMDETARERDHVTPPDPQRWAEQMEVLRIFDQLIYNIDRNTGNMLITKDWRLWMIDHSRSFRLHKQLPAPNRIYRCERTLFEKMQQLDEAVLMRELRPYLNRTEIQAMLARRDEIVRILNERRTKSGDAATFYDLRGETLHANLTN